jgi:hypothetical protein
MEYIGGRNLTKYDGRSFEAGFLKKRDELYEFYIPDSLKSESNSNRLTIYNKTKDGRQKKQKPTPAEAAKKVYSRLKKSNKYQSEFVVAIRETTHNSPNKIYLYNISQLDIPSEKQRIIKSTNQQNDRYLKHKTIARKTREDWLNYNPVPKHIYKQI